MAPGSTLPGWLAAALDSLAAGDLDGWLDMFAPDGIHEFPWAPEGRVRRLDGHEEMRAYLSQLHGRIEFGGFSDVHVHEVGEDTIIQATGHHTRPDGTPRRLDYIWFITRRDGKVKRLQDYMNPAQVSTS
jgi:ketosteroid isomerase-like protein